MIGGIVHGRWHPGIGDPTVMGWVTVVCYTLVTAVAFWAWVSRRITTDRFRGDPVELHNQRMMARLWFFCTVLLAVLGVNKQLDLQSWFTQVLRDIAVRGNWYDERRKYQVEFVIAIFVIGMTGTLLIAYWLRHVFRRAALAIAGIGMLVIFVVIRAASYHYIDRLLMIGTVRLNWVLEIGGIALIGLGIVTSERQERHRVAAAAAVVRHAPIAENAKSPEPV